MQLHDKYVETRLNIRLILHQMKFVKRKDDLRNICFDKSIESQTTHNLYRGRKMRSTFNQLVEEAGGRNNNQPTNPNLTKKLNVYVTCKPNPLWQVI